MERVRSVVFVIGFLLVVIAVLFGTFYFANQYLIKNNATAMPLVSNCKLRYIGHFVAIRNDIATPQHTQAKLCDTLTITNSDNKILLIAFGPPEHHQPYDGVTERLLSNNQSLTITLNQVGTYSFHDHLQDKVTGDFTVTK